MSAAFAMEVRELITGPAMNLADAEVLVAGPTHGGPCRLGDQLIALAGEVEVGKVTCIGIELVNWGASRRDWISLRVTGMSEPEVTVGLTLRLG